MKGPRCSDHGSMVRDLALGRLDDEIAARAGEMLATCTACSQWWEATLEGDAVAEVDAAVASAIAVFKPRRVARRWMHGGLAAAAAIVIGLGVATITRHTPDPVIPPADQVASVEATAPTLVATLDFESGIVDGQLQVVSKVGPAPAPQPAADDASLHAVTMETGDLSGWSSHS